METYQEFISVFPNFLLKFFVAIVCGGIIGLERELRGKPAGLRTNILICLGSTLYMLISEFVAVKLLATPSDPTRIAAQVVTGIGFIGAGTIIQSRGTISGLTSAAVIWTVAAIGLCIGAGFPTIALLFTLLVFLVLHVLARYENKLLGRCHFVSSTISFKDNGKVWSEISEILGEYSVTTADYTIAQTKKRITMNIRYCDKHTSHNRFIFDLWKVSGEKQVSTENAPPLSL
ncbi:MAG: MgtC/SapB family protein [Bacteroidota bacterium]